MMAIDLLMMEECYTSLRYNQFFTSKFSMLKVNAIKFKSAYDQLMAWRQTGEPMIIFFPTLVKMVLILKQVLRWLTRHSPFAFWHLAPALPEGFGCPSFVNPVNTQNVGCGGFCIVADGRVRGSHLGLATRWGAQRCRHHTVRFDAEVRCQHTNTPWQRRSESRDFSQDKSYHLAKDLKFNH